MRDRVTWALGQVREILGEVLGPGGVAAFWKTANPACGTRTGGA